jgi:hypothetical protein
MTDAETSAALCLCTDPESVHDMGGERWQDCGRPGCGCTAFRTDSRVTVVDDLGEIAATGGAA